MEFHARQIRPPKSWEEFEDLTLTLFRHVWNDPHAQKKGRSGQAQAGADVWGRPSGSDKRHFGVQCKGKDQLLNSKVTEKELRAEVEKAKSFRPQLDHWILATTAEKDARIEEVARTVSVENEAAGLFSVQVFGWEDLQSLIADHPEVMEKHYRDQAPSSRAIARSLVDFRDHQAEADRKLNQIMLTQETILGAISSATLGGGADIEDVKLQAQIDAGRDLMNAGQPRTALRIFENLVAEHWEAASARGRFRLLTNQGAAHYVLGNLDVAADLFLRAAPYGQGDILADVNAALANVLLGNVEAARSIADAVLAREPGNSNAATIRVMASLEDEGIVDPLAVLPQAARGGAEVLAMAARWHRHRGRQDIALDLFERAFSLDPSDAHIQADLAVALLEPLVNDPVLRLMRRLDGDRGTKVERAIRLLRDAWGSVQGTETACAHTVTALNLSSALRFAGRFKEAGDVLDQALSAAPAEVILLKDRAALLIGEDRDQEALAVLDRVPADGASRPELMLMRAGVLANLGRHTEALTIFAALARADDEVGHKTTLEHVRVLWNAKRETEATEVAVSVADAHPESPAALLALSLVRRRKGDLSAAREAAARALAFTPAEDALGRLLAADALFMTKDWDGVLNALAPLRGAWDTDVVRLLLSALVNADRRREAVSVIEDLPPDIANSTVCLRAAAIVYERAGDLETARSKAEAYLAQEPGNLEVRLLWLAVVDGLKDTAAIGAFLDGPLEGLAGASPELQIAIAHTLDRYGRGERALQVAYAALRESWANPRVHMGYNALFFMGKSVSAAVRSPEVVGPDTSFTLSPTTGSAQFSFTIEAKHTPLSPTLGELGPTSSLASKVLGLRVGDEVIVEDHPAAEPVRIIEIKDKYLHLFHRSLEEFNRLFPGERGFIKLTFDETNPDRTVKQMHAFAQARRDHVERAIEAYQSGPIPIAVMARLAGTGMVDAWYGLIECNTRLKVCDGTAPERTDAMQALKRLPRLVVDPLTFWIAGALGVLPALADTFGPLGIAWSTVEMLERCRDERAAWMGSRQGTVTVGDQDGTIIMTEASPEQMKASLNLANKVLAFARSSEVLILPAIPGDGFRHGERRIWSFMDPSVLDTLAAASGSGRLLLCEDQGLRKMGAQAARVSGVWLQPALMTAVAAGKLEKESYLQATATLALAGHHFTSLSDGELLHVAQRCGWAAGVEFQKLARLFGGPFVEPRSAEMVVASFLAKLWSRALPRQAKESLSATLLGAALANRPGEVSVFKDFLDKAVRPRLEGSREKRLRASEAFRRFLSKWAIEYEKVTAAITGIR